MTSTGNESHAQYVLEHQYQSSNHAQIFQLVFDGKYVGPIAQSVEQRTFNPWVDGSSPSGPTNLISRNRFWDMTRASRGLN